MPIFLALLACAPPVVIHTAGTATAPLQVVAHSSDGALAFEGFTESDGTLQLSQLSPGSSVAVTAIYGDPPTYIWTESVLDVRPGDVLTIDRVQPWDPDRQSPDAGELVLDPGEPPERAVSLWVGLIECSTGPFTSETAVRLPLDGCSGEVTPVAIAQDALARPIAFKRAEAVDAATLAGETLRLDGAWREDWSFVRLDVEGQGSSIAASLRVGRFLHYELHPAAPFSVAFPVVPGLELAGSLAVELSDEGDRLGFQHVARGGDRLLVDLSDAIEPPVAALSSSAEGLALAAQLPSDCAALDLNLVTQLDGVTHSWQGRLDPDLLAVLPEHAVDPTMGEGGYGTLRLLDGPGNARTRRASLDWVERWREVDLSVSSRLLR